MKANKARAQIENYMVLLNFYGQYLQLLSRLAIILESVYVVNQEIHLTIAR